MNKKSIITSILSVFIFSLAFGYSLVFAWASFFDSNLKISFKLSDNIYLDSLNLKSTNIVFSSYNKLDWYSIKSKCDIYWKLKNSSWNNYVFDLKFFDSSCEDDNFALVNKTWEEIFNFELNVVSEYTILSTLLDLSTDKLEQLYKVLDDKVIKYSDYVKYDPNSDINYYDFLLKNRALNEALYNKNIVKNILEKRSEKYIIPVLWYSLPERADKIPNASRPYRQDYTDWIHHSWDIDTSFWENVVALDDWIIIRVVDNWSWSDFSFLKYWEISDYDKMKNLDILRWNQVWIKTMKWEVVFYNHLNDIFTNIKEWVVVNKWQPLGTIWISWVPDKNYDDYHLDFSVGINPYDNSKAWTYDIDDYMNWPWLFKWENREYILENQYNYFEN